MRRQNKIIATFVSVSGLIVIEKIIGFVRQIIVASSFGATVETDIINLSQNTVSDIQYILAQALITAFVSIYIHIQQADGEGANRTNSFAGDAIIAFTIIAMVLSAILYMSSDIIAKVLAPSYSDELNSRLSHYIRIYSPIILLFTLNCIFIAILAANKSFFPEQLANFNASATTIILTLFLGPVLGTDTLVISCYAYTVCNVIFLGVLCRRRIEIRPGNPYKNGDIIKLFRMVAPLLLGYSLISVNQMVDRMLVSGLGSGVITSLSYGSTLSNIITTFITTFCNIIYSYFTSEVSARRYKSASVIVNNSVKLLSVLFMPITITFVICSHEIVSIVYGRGAFDQHAVISASLALKGYAIMYIPVILRELYSRFQYAFQDSKRPMINGSIGIVGNIVLSIVFCRVWGIFGVALATSISIAISGLCNMVTARRKTSELSYETLKWFAVKVIVATLIAVSVGRFIYSNAMLANHFFMIAGVLFSCFLVFGLLLCKDVYTAINEIKRSRDEAYCEPRAEG